jgi:hypothetical protein
MYMQMKGYTVEQPSAQRAQEVNNNAVYALKNA